MAVKLPYLIITDRYVFVRIIPLNIYFLHTIQQSAVICIVFRLQADQTKGMLVPPHK